MATTLLISTFPPFPSLTLTLPSDTPVSEVSTHLPDFLPSLKDADLYLSLASGTCPPASTPLSALCSPAKSQRENESDEVDALSSRLVSMRLTPRLRGGKGGFGSQLRAAGGRMSSQKTSNNDSCRDLNGRRLSTIKEAKALASYLESEPERKKAQHDAQRAKLESLERMLGIAPGGKGKEKEEGSTGVKRRFDDTEYLEQSRDIVDNVKSAVSAAMLKKRKKAKKATTPEGEASPSGSSEEKPVIGESTQAEIVEKVLESPATAPVAAVAAASLAAVGA